MKINKQSLNSQANIILINCSIYKAKTGLKFLKQLLHKVVRANCIVNNNGKCITNIQDNLSYHDNNYLLVMELNVNTDTLMQIVFIFIVSTKIDKNMNENILFMSSVSTFTP